MVAGKVGTALQDVGEPTRRGSAHLRGYEAMGESGVGRLAPSVKIGQEFAEIQICENIELAMGLIHPRKSA
jgi:hypothetical protein